MNRQAVQTLKTYFGYDTFREGQESVVESILEHRDVLAIMPTGAGKSICYQVPALMLSGITIVISPLISLMQDQVKALNEAGIHAAFINSSLSESQISKALYLAAGGRYKIIYVAPERLENYEFLEFARQVEISMVTVDEAHCISQWGQDFRPSYVKIVDFVKNLPGRPIVSAFTATATEEVKNDILCTLNLEDPKVVITGFDRKNLYYSVENIRRKDDFVMDHISHIGFINPHSKCICCNNNGGSVVNEIILILFSGFIIQSCMISGNSNSFLEKQFKKIVHIFSCRAVNNPALC